MAFIVMYIVSFLPVPTTVSQTTSDTLKHRINPSLGLAEPQTVHVLLYTPGTKLQCSLLMVSFHTDYHISSSSSSDIWNALFSSNYQRSFCVMCWAVISVHTTKLFLSSEVIMCFAFSVWVPVLLYVSSSLRVSVTRHPLKILNVEVQDLKKWRILQATNQNRSWSMPKNKSDKYIDYSYTFYQDVQKLAYWLIYVYTLACLWGTVLFPYT